ncbi:hypothetical protein HMP0721_0861 [Pseudoramibacter alactolyticus ATCC 23263]|uniref:Uncharacterized protein n=1 Tax=Pseudoramibacter alactolyticus ATCC 23263 TaxID=887929 RepID=E6MFV0_9FIRM|nr:hypothetical protein HMP0721_0861 [Pseudoramibacter alactolyticus ATCC 23263]
MFWNEKDVILKINLEAAIFSALLFEGRHVKMKSPTEGKCWERSGR